MPNGRGDRIQAVSEMVRYITPLLLGVMITLLSTIWTSVDAIRDKQAAFGERIRALEVHAGIGQVEKVKR